MTVFPLAYPDLFRFIKSLREIVFERKLNLGNMCIPTVTEIIPVAILQFNAHHGVLDGVIHDVGNSVLALMERISILGIGVVDVD
jgi:hypothetical protein